MTLHEKPIKLPGSLYWTIFRRFGTDELIAMVFNVASTGIASIFYSNPLVLATVGPVLEKFGFFPAHIKEAWEVYKTTPPKQRKKFTFYLKQALKNGSVSLLEDILIHDPLYVSMMVIGLKAYPTTPAWLLSFVSFVVAIMIVPLVEILIVQLRFRRYKNKLKKMGFEEEEYYETRFLIDTKYDSEKLLKNMAKEFGLDERSSGSYHDVYYDTDLPNYLNYIPRVRFRRRQTDEKRQTVQVVWTRAFEMCGRKYEQSRYFPISKSKFYYPVKDELNPFRDIPLMNNCCDKHANTPIQFDRSIVYNDKLFVSADRPWNTSYYCVEMKAYKENTDTLRQAMRYAMTEFPIVQTTESKIDLKEIGQ